jgi:hypothetical protein
MLDDEPLIFPRMSDDSFFEGVKNDGERKAAIAMDMNVVPRIPPKIDLMAKKLGPWCPSP